MVSCRHGGCRSRWRTRSSPVSWHIFQGGWSSTRLRLTTPVAGPLNVKILLARVCSAWGTLAAVGHPVVRLDVLQELADNRYFSLEVLEPLSRSVRYGARPVSRPAGHPRSLAPTLLAQMMAVGEDSGDLATIFRKLSIFYEEDVGSSWKRFSNSLKPVLMFTLGIIVCIVMLAVFLPLSQLVTHL